MHTAPHVSYFSSCTTLLNLLLANLPPPPPHSALTFLPAMTDARSLTADAPLRPSRIADVRELYDAPASAQFFSIIVGDGGPHVHSGVYRSPTDPTRVAAEHSSEVLRALGEQAGAVLRPGVRVLDLGAGVGGAARKLATETGVSVTCLNLSATQNEVNEAATAAAGLSHLVTVEEGSYEDLPAGWTATFDVVWCQDAICHSNAKAKVLAEAARVLVPGGYLLLSDMMAGVTADAAALAPFCVRLHVDELLPLDTYIKALQASGVATLRTRDLTAHLLPNYRRMLARLTTERGRLDRCSDAYVATVRGLLRDNIEVMGKGEAQTWAALVGRKEGGHADDAAAAAAGPRKRWISATLSGLTVTEVKAEQGGPGGGGMGLCRTLLAAVGIDDYQAIEVYHAPTGAVTTTYACGVDDAGAVVVPRNLWGRPVRVGDAVHVTAYADCALPMVPRVAACAAGNVLTGAGSE